MEEDCQGTAPWVLGQAQGKLAAPRPLLEQGKKPFLPCWISIPTLQRPASGSRQLWWEQIKLHAWAGGEREAQDPAVGQGLQQRMLRTLRLARGPVFVTSPR